MSELLILKPEGFNEYKIIIENSFNTLIENLKELNIENKKICIVTEKYVAGIYLERISSILYENCKAVSSYVFKPGEKHKTLNTVQGIYEHLINEHFDRNDLLIALGGGVTGDLTGYVASTYMRGIDFIQIPTTLLSQVDSSIGGKTGVDFKQYKNMVGAFHHPRLVYINVETLKTLPAREFSSGMAEVIKHGMIMDLTYYKWLDENKTKILEYENNILIEMIYKSCHIKKTVVEEDPFEKGLRAILNFGHTIGHAIEKYKNFELLHGECVSLGMVAALRISFDRGNISFEELSSAIKLLKFFRLPTFVPSINTDKVSNFTLSDKKMDSGVIKFILLDSMGKALIDKSVTSSEIKSSINNLKNGE